MKILIFSMKILIFLRKSQIFSIKNLMMIFFMILFNDL